MQWFRLYDDLLDDPKCQQLRPELFKLWVNLLCLANKGTPRGTLPAIPAIAFRLRLSEAKTAGILRELEAAGLLDCDGETLRPHNWDDRQKRSDNVAARVAKHRQSVSSNEDVTLHTRYMKQDGNVLDTDTDTDTEQSTPPLSPQGGDEPKPKPEPKPKATRLKDGWEPSETCRSWARSNDFTDDEVAVELEKFRDHHRQKGTLGQDWDAGFRNWLRRSRELVARAPTPLRVNGNGKPPLPPIVRGTEIPADGGLAEFRALQERGYSRN